MPFKYFLKKHFKKAQAALLVFGVVACSSSNNPFEQNKKKSNLEQERMEGLLAQPQSIVFADVQQLVFESRCVECHSGEQPDGAVDLSSFESLFKGPADLVVPGAPEESLLYDSLTRLKGGQMMPPDPLSPLSKEQKTLVYQWILNGALESQGDEAKVSPSLTEQLRPYFQAPETIDYAVVKKFVFKPGRCFSCHSYSGMRPDPKAMLFGADFNTYEDLFLLGGIVPGVPSDKIIEVQGGPAVLRKGSRVYQAIAVDQTMPPASEGYKPLNALRVKLLRLWIANCAIDDFEKIEKDRLIEEPSSPAKVRNCL